MANLQELQETINNFQFVFHTWIYHLHFEFSPLNCSTDRILFVTKPITIVLELMWQSDASLIGLYTVGLETVKKIATKYDHTFGTYKHSWVGCKWIFFKLCLATRGRCNHFSQSWNFELKIFLDIHFLTKIGSTGLWIHFLPQIWVKMAKN